VILHSGRNLPKSTRFDLLRFLQGSANQQWIVHQGKIAPDRTRRKREKIPGQKPNRIV
jgi:hypothetical protein